MTENVKDVTAQRDQLAADNASLRDQLASLQAATRTVGTAAVQHKFMLTEGGRQELELYGVATIGGVLMTREQAMAAAEEAGQPVEIGEPSPDLDRREQVRTDQAKRGPGIRGFDYVYPSVAPGVLDPAVAGTPGVSGPVVDVKAGK